MQQSGLRRILFSNRALRYHYKARLRSGAVRHGTLFSFRCTNENRPRFHAVENRHNVTDIHATTQHLLGLDSRRLEVSGRKRLDVDHGCLIRQINA